MSVGSKHPLASTRHGRCSKQALSLASGRRRSPPCFQATKAAWGEASPGPIDCLFAIERLGAPYRNIRGVDISAHTEPVDCLWPLAAPHLAVGGA